MNTGVNGINKLLVTCLGNIKVGVSQRMTAMGRTASGRSVASLAVEVNGFEGTLYGDKQWEVMQRGRKPGKVPYNFRETIKNWAIDKGISIQPRKGQSQKQALESFSYLVSRNIMQKGTKLYRDKGYNNIYDTVLKEELKKLANGAASLVGQGVDKINVDFIK